MFTRESSYALMRHKSSVKSRGFIDLDGQRHWRVNEPSNAEAVGIPGRCIYAQNDTYLEVCNPGWNMQWMAGMGLSMIVIPWLFLIFGWYGFALHPLLFGKVMFFWPTLVLDYRPGSEPYVWFGWLLLFPLAAAATFLLYGCLIPLGMRTGFFTYLRGRIRFNRQTRKVYVLRPSYCGGNMVFEWERLVALFDARPTEGRKGDESVLVLYHPPFDANDPEAKGEDCIFVGPDIGSDMRVEATANFWEYIRRYMEIGPTVGEIPENAPEDYKEVPRYIPEPYTTFCGKPSAAQYGLEERPGLLQTSYHMLSQVTCSWPKFPKEWQSDSGIGEPEDRPVQAGAVITALGYRAKGKLSKADEVELMRRYGTEEGQAEAKARSED